MELSVMVLMSSGCGFAKLHNRRQKNVRDLAKTQQKNAADKIEQEIDDFKRQISELDKKIISYIISSGR